MRRDREGNRQTDGADRAGRQTDRQTGQTDRAGRQGKETGKTDRQTDRAGGQAGRQTDRADRQTDRADRQTDRETDKCVECNEWILPLYAANIPEPKAGQKMIYKIDILHSATTDWRQRLKIQHSYGANRTTVLSTGRRQCQRGTEKTVHEAE